MASVILKEIDADQFGTEIATQVLKILEPQIRSSNFSEVLGRTEMAKRLSVSVPTLDRMTADGTIPSAMLRNRIPMALLYGGGYNRQADYTAKLHRNTVVTAKRILGEVRGLVS